MTPTADDRRPTSRLLRQLLPPAAFVATFGVFAADKNREARTVLSSWRGLLAVAAIVTGYVLVGVVLRRRTTRPWIAPVVLTLVIVGLAAWIVRPYYVDTTVNRRLVSGPVAEERATPADAGAAAETAGSPTAAAGPVIVASGPLSGIDHRARGTAALVRAADGSLVVRLIDFDIEGVPDPRVYLLQGDDAERPGGDDLGRLPGNKGAVLDIPVPAGSTAGRGWTVLIWCRAFSVPIANATLGS